MSRSNTLTSKLTAIANDGIEEIRNCHHHARWLAALMTAIHHELDRGPAILECHVSRAKDLASLGQYLGDDLANYTDCRAEELQSKLDSAEAQE
ncbi:hypothetical protein [Pseudomonas nitroreducens]|uniref:hypothetical protein n=1 Tax=Pseudomonas nitroreducens TaxID=46680 RepID=UPI003CC827A7